MLTILAERRRAFNARRRAPSGERGEELTEHIDLKEQNNGTTMRVPEGTPTGAVLYGSLSYV